MILLCTNISSRQRRECIDQLSFEAPMQCRLFVEFLVANHQVEDNQELKQCHRWNTIQNVFNNKNTRAFLLSPTQLLSLLMQKYHLQRQTKYYCINDQSTHCLCWSGSEHYKHQIFQGLNITNIQIFQSLNITNIRYFRV